MKESRPLARALIGLVGIAILAIGALEMRAEHWPLYVLVAGLTVVLTVPPVWILPDVPLPLPLMAMTSGFVYIGGLPILAVYAATELVMRGLVRLLPSAWIQYMPGLRVRGGDDVYGRAHYGHVAQILSIEFAVFVIGLAVRWWTANALSGGAPLWTTVVVIGVAELVGYAVWGGLSVLPIYPDRPLFPAFRHGIAPVVGDVALLQIVMTAFVYLIVYGYGGAGLFGAGTFACASIGTLAVLNRLNDRRLQLAEQNRRLEQLNRELEHRERLSAIGKMASVISHQILQELGVIGIYANLVRTASTDEGSAPESALARVRLHGAAIEGALADVNRILRDLLVFSRDLRVNPYRHDVASLVEEATAAARPAAREHAVALRVECPPALAASFDKLKMKQALENVLRNAIDASPPGGEVIVQAARRDGRLEITVSDQGPGVPPESREAIFTPFFTTKEHGSGLGLAIAREFTRAHGGDIDVLPGPNGRGARFRLRLPLAAEAVKAAPATAGRTQEEPNRRGQ